MLARWSCLKTVGIIVLNKYTLQINFITKILLIKTLYSKINKTQRLCSFMNLYAIKIDIWNREPWSFTLNFTLSLWTIYFVDLFITRTEQIQSWIKTGKPFGIKWMKVFFCVQSSLTLFCSPSSFQHTRPYSQARLFTYAHILLARYY